mmetsp:Transcript_1061/g.1220  ORF Transcript_1061/g.1220 Transcript_1061/m.1220 type:complete len:91 (-) Transcript_1061:743-1015(-)
MARKTASQRKKTKLKSKSASSTAAQSSVSDMPTTMKGKMMVRDDCAMSHSGDKTDITCDCFLRRGSLFLPPSLLRNDMDMSTTTDSSSKA